MYEQILYYNLTIFQVNSFAISINALLLLVIFLISLKYKKDIIYKIIYLLMIVGVSNLLIFSTNNVAIFDLEVFSRVNFFIYNLFNYPINSLNTYFMVYSYINILIFIPYYSIFRNHKYFIYFISLYSLLQIIFVSIHVSSTNFSVYYILLNVIGYLIGYYINRLKGGNVIEDEQ